MKFLLNMNVPRELGKRLASQGHTFRHVGDIGMARASDVMIADEARKNQETASRCAPDGAPLSRQPRDDEIEHNYRS